MTVLDTYDHLKMTVALPCWHCGVPTPWVELNFESALHPGPCTLAKWAEYHAANRSQWLPDGTWRDPDCIECGGEGAPCCEPPDTPGPPLSAPPTPDQPHDPAL